MDLKDKFDSWMQEMVRIDSDLPAVPRWQLLGVFQPEIAYGLKRVYGKKVKS